ncbi:Ribonuclease/ribotoxin [Microdochium trichocladiopsis]|uniref:ribonuclease T1 n=1 Tax=Microdochium trichocladiopsis TaxID=1682393 RepID=A0A9P8XUG6_9PEZI|nr:Ribonuclease/ribotoxin [Microdochium trichocladiopsis]KAH7018115.1 Ribonuclease/ribotoxin [Microdochium trichocladiopsis]
MQLTSIFTALVLGATAVAAAAVPQLEPRAAATCGSVFYSATAVNAASQRACTNYKNGNAPGGYPHTFNNREGFSFAVAGPYLEFPIMSSGALYTGGSPGPDRVVINTNSCQQAGAITHTGASGNNFVKCK